MGPEADSLESRGYGPSERISLLEQGSESRQDSSPRVHPFCNLNTLLPLLLPYDSINVLSCVNMFELSFCHLQPKETIQERKHGVNHPRSGDLTTCHLPMKATHLSIICQQSLGDISTNYSKKEARENSVTDVHSTL